MLHIPWPCFHTIQCRIDTSLCLRTYTKTINRTNITIQHHACMHVTHSMAFLSSFHTVQSRFDKSPSLHIYTKTTKQDHHPTPCVYACYTLHGLFTPFSVELTQASVFTPTQRQPNNIAIQHHMYFFLHTPSPCSHTSKGNKIFLITHTRQKVCIYMYHYMPSPLASTKSENQNWKFRLEHQHV